MKDIIAISRRRRRIDSVEFISPRALKCPATWLSSSNSTELCRWLQSEKDVVRQSLHSFDAIVLKGFAPLSESELSLAARELTGDTIAYTERTTPRRHLSEQTYTATEYPQHQEIFLHNENSYASHWPRYLYLYCRQPAAAGGETLLADLDHVMEHIAPNIIQHVHNRKLMHRRVFRSGLGEPWRIAFNVDSLETLARFCRESGYDLDRSDERKIVVEYRHLPMARSPIDHQIRWFNHAAFFQQESLDAATRDAMFHLYGEDGLPNRMLYGDGAPIEAEIVLHLRNAYREAEWAYSWESNDLLIVDNMRFAHGRRPFSGARTLWVAMSGRVRREDSEP